MAEVLVTFLSVDVDRATEPPDQYTLALGDYLLAMARHKLGHHAQAHRYYLEAVDLHENLQNQIYTDQSTSQSLSAPWLWIVELNAIRRKAGHIDS